MKRIIFLICILSQFLLVGQSQHPSFLVTPKQIEEVFTKSTNDKPIFLEAYLPTCGHCMAFNETFQNPILKSFLESNFQAYQIDLSKKENQDFLRKKKIYVYSTPTFLVFGKNGELWNFDAAENEFNSVEGIMTLLNKAKSPDKKQIALLEKYKKNSLTKEELIEIGTFTRYTLDTTSNIHIVNELTRLMSPTEYESELAYKIIQKIMMDEENPLFEYFIKNLKKYQLYADSANVSRTAENVVMNSLYNPNAKTYAVARFEKMKGYLLKIGVPSKAVATRFIYYEVLQFLQQKNQQAAVEKIKKYYQQTTIPTKEKEFWCNTLKRYNSAIKDCPL